MNDLSLKPVNSHSSGDPAQSLVCWHKRLLWRKGLPASLRTQGQSKMHLWLCSKSRRLCQSAGVFLGTGFSRGNM